MFRKLHPLRSTLTIFVDDNPFVVDAADTVAAALLGAGVTRFHSSAVTNAPRGPYCMIGVCFECLLEIDGQPDRQACQTQVREGMRIRTAV